MTDWKKEYEKAHCEHGEMLDRFEWALNQLETILAVHDIDLSPYETDMMNTKRRLYVRSVKRWRTQEERLRGRWL